MKLFNRYLKQNTVVTRVDVLSNAEMLNSLDDVLASLRGNLNTYLAAQERGSDRHGEIINLLNDAIRSLNTINDYLADPGRIYLGKNVFHQLEKAMNRLSTFHSEAVTVSKIIATLIRKEKRKEAMLKADIWDINTAVLRRLGTIAETAEAVGGIETLDKAIRNFTPTYVREAQTAGDVLDFLETIKRSVLSTKAILADRELLDKLEIIVTWGLDAAFSKGVEEEDSSRYRDIVLFLELIDQGEEFVEEN